MSGRPSAPTVIDVWDPMPPMVSTAVAMTAVHAAVVQRATFKLLLAPST